MGYQQWSQTIIFKQCWIAQTIVFMVVFSLSHPFLHFQILVLVSKFCFTKMFVSQKKFTVNIKRKRDRFRSNNIYWSICVMLRSSQIIVKQRWVRIRVWCHESHSLPQSCGQIIMWECVLLFCLCFNFISVLLSLNVSLKTSLVHTFFSKVYHLLF